MSYFITYAQNFEDLMLWRALRHVKEGFYIDVGAADPDEHSVTRAFYDRGWRGINIEPAPGHFEALVAARERDITLCCLAGATPNMETLYHFAGTGLSTTETGIATRHLSDGRVAQELEVPVRTLADICCEYAPENVHFLKIDVEGAEEAVLRGADFSLVRPWIILVEATEPLTTTENWDAWETILDDAGYRFIWFDGLNRFYLAVEHWCSLRHAFAVPPNVFDYWIQPQDHQRRALLNHAQSIAASAQHAASASRTELVAALRDANASRDALARAERTTAEALATVEKMRRSASWRITAPARTATGLGRRLLLGSRAWLALRPGSRPRRMARNGTSILARFVLARPHLAYPAKWLLRHFPLLEHRLKSSLSPPDTCAAPNWDVPYLTRYARQIYDELNRPTERGSS